MRTAIILEGSVSYGIQKLFLLWHNGDNYVLSEYNRPVMQPYYKIDNPYKHATRSVRKSSTKPTLFAKK
jgi:hypothetical protein